MLPGFGGEGSGLGVGCGLPRCEPKSCQVFDNTRMKAWEWPDSFCRLLGDVAKKYEEIGILLSKLATGGKVV